MNEAGARPKTPEDSGPGPPMSINCPKCRTPIGKEIKFCTSCGAKVDEVRSVDRPVRD